jgi:hypothetical protein
MRENIEEAANELLAHFNHRNQDALLKVTKNTLESLRKRITSSSMVHYLGKMPVEFYINTVKGFDFIKFKFCDFYHLLQYCREI